MKRYILVSALTLFSLASFGQMYSSSIGLRAGFAQGLTYKKFTSDTKAVEGILSTFRQGFMGTILLEYHKPFESAPNLYWYVGYGAHLGYWSGIGASNNPWFDGSSGPFTVIGLDGVLGIEYPFPEFPFTVALDWKPYINLIGHLGPVGRGTAVSLRYRLD